MSFLYSELGNSRLVLRVCAKFYGVTEGLIRGPWRGKTLVHARHMAMWAARRFTPESYPEIARAFGGRHHTSVMHAVREVESRLSVGNGVKEAAILSELVSGVISGLRGKE